MTTPQITITIAGVLCLLALLRWLIRKARIRRFHVVERGRVYRGGQPNPLALWLMARIFKVKTIVNLREDYIENQNLFGMNEKRILLPPRTNVPTKEQLDEFLAIMDDADAYPVLIHCKVGANRTGIMVAAWRILRQGWSYDDALDEMKEISGKVVPELPQKTLKTLTSTLA